MIRFEKVSKTYDDQTLVVDSINLEIDRGEFLVLIGPSGCGKTTTLKMINRLIPLTDGTIWIDNKKVSEYPIHELRWRIGYVLQQIALFPHMTIEENIAIVPELKKWKKERIHARVTELLDMVGLDADTYRHRKPSELSGGQQQRIGVIRALAADPDIILMDEPFSALDPISRAKLQDDLMYLQKTIKKTIVFVTHDIQEALKLADRLCIMKDGKIEQIGTPQEVTSQPATAFVHEFITSGIPDPFKIADHLQPLEEGFDRFPTVSIDEGWAKLLNSLVASEQVAVQKEGEVVGTISRETVIAYLANDAREGRLTNE
ncbi:glycine/betaine ABC transporter ATP-binding protein [Sporosarcina sp. NCCP-2222]|uniref:ABC transporter ATP-binding protein n=1 Tax=Sporosarcina sp. NCCP-2222 TaxID=2935073 RepID=UPI00207F3B1D|nr:ABC transporter ATP-binding protein [Sporosarcina sp. NCCP-2222]GKV56456.1 glycine/betaine ABC transporter ATP-binding protein [Sporosarcina sp. NCCP-2222]